MWKKVIHKPLKNIGNTKMKYSKRIHTYKTFHVMIAKNRLSETPIQGYKEEEKSIN